MDRFWLKYICYFQSFMLNAHGDTSSESESIAVRIALSARMPLLYHVIHVSNENDRRFNELNVVMRTWWYGVFSFNLTSMKMMLLKYDAFVACAFIIKLTAFVITKGEKNDLIDK